jgi:hypothetical protein
LLLSVNIGDLSLMDSHIQHRMNMGFTTLSIQNATKVFSFACIAREINIKILTAEATYTYDKRIINRFYLVSTDLSSVFLAAMLFQTISRQFFLYKLD